MAAQRQQDEPPLNVDLKQLREIQRIVSGIHAVYGAVYESLGLDRLLPAWRYRAAHRALFHSVMARLANPKGKRASVWAKKDRRDRDKALDELRKKLLKRQPPKALLNNYGYKKYLQVTGETTLSINQDKVNEAQRWDDLHGVITNLPADTDPARILNQYHGLWQVEDTFRASKHNLKVRPIYHWTSKRIRAHIAIAFITLLCVRHLPYRLALQARPVSSEAI